MFTVEKSLMRIVFAFTIGCLLFVSCAKKLPTSTKDYADSNKETILTNYENNRLNFSTLEAKVKTSIDSEEAVFNFTSTIRIVKDKQIWISGGLFGFEAARLLVTKDSVKLINRLEKTYALEPISKLQEITKLPVNFQDIQQILLGEIVKFNFSEAQLKSGHDNIVMMTENERVSNTVEFNATNLQIIQQLITDKVKNNSVYMQLSDYQLLENSKPFSNHREIQVLGEENIVFTLNFQSIELNVDLNFPFNINPRYERIYY